MKYAVVGGDRRSALLAGLLLREGNRVRSFALEKAELPAEIPKDSCLQSCVRRCRSRSSGARSGRGSW